MKEGDLVRNRHNQFTGRIGGLLTRTVGGKPVVERVLILRENQPGARMWCDVGDVEFVAAASGEIR
jgi:hypothetical protein